MKNNRMGLDLTQGSVVRQMVLFALPMLAATALQQLYTMVDMVVAGQFLGRSGLSSVSVASQVVMFMTCLCIGFSGGAQVVISQYVGARRQDELRAIIGNTFLVHAASALLFSVIGITLCEPMLRLLNAPEEAFQGAKEYLIICSIGLIFVYGYNMVSAVLRGMGDSTRPLLFIAIASVTNIVLDLLFIGPMGLGAAGAALATVISQAVSFLIALAYLYRRRDRFGFDFRLASFRPHARILRQLIQQGLPQGLQMAAIIVSFLFIMANVNRFGVAASAAFGVGLKIEHLPSIATQGFSTAVGAMVGQNFGAGKFDRIRTTTRVALVVSTVSFSIFGLLYLLIPEQMFRLFTQDEEVLALARTVLGAMVLGYPANILMNAYRGVIIGVGNAAFGLAIGIFDGVVLRMGLAWVLGSVLNLGLFGFVLGYALAAYGTAIPAAVYYWSGIWKRRRSLVAED